ncbi:MAG TPA: class I SAM-dependent methyltransferase [candidate division Zixibacteria bacterium]|nr:class I SAM-dependent methyltransferase [candidate division Zixibacteria bacterium]
MLTEEEVRFLYRLSRFKPEAGVIVEIGSFKGKSTIALASGAAGGLNAKVYAIDPHLPIPEEGYSEYTEAEFLRNIDAWGVGDCVVPMITTSERAAENWSRPIRLLWIDGDHRYGAVRLDFKLWEPHVVEGGIIAMHDSIRKPGVKRVLWEEVFRSGRFRDIMIVDNITAVRKVKKVSPGGVCRKWATLALRAIYIAARKSRVPYSKPLGRRLLRRLTVPRWVP